MFDTTVRFLMEYRVPKPPKQHQNQGCTSQHYRSLVGRKTRPILDQSVVGRPPSVSTQVQICHHPYHGISDIGLRSCKPSGCSLSLQLLSGGGDVFMRVIYIPMHILVHIPFIFILCLCRSA